MSHPPVRVLVTGATGMVGRILCEQLAQSGCIVRAALRTDGPLPMAIAEKTLIGEITGASDWTEALSGVDYVVHAAARTHVLHDTAANSGLYTETNAKSTRRLAEMAARSGVRRFVYLSSIKVNGEESGARSFLSTDPPDPKDAYGRSKLEGEQALLDIASAHGMEAAIVRPPLVYGPGVRANFLRLMRWVDFQRPLPLGAVRNRRSLVSVWNLVELLLTLLRHEAAPGRVWMVSDGVDLSTAQLVERLGRALRRSPRLVAVPESVLRFSAGLFGRGAEFARLCGSLTVDVGETRRLLGWSPAITVDEGLARTADWYRSTTPEVPPK
ncbi:MAG TPA: NAD-dependent epimerase/dehydratase family protein [Steroidobacteraceae bacterium]|nr:NAD-dependent epimerase/dehydratase family protein [Steroidobacteraceae bacterium]